MTVQTNPHDIAHRSGAATPMHGQDLGAETTARPLAPGSAQANDGEPLRELEPRSIRQQFGQNVDIQPEPNQQEGVKEWVRLSPGMTESFPDTGKP